MRIIVLIIYAAFLTPIMAFGKSDCGSLENHYGPYDYTNPMHVKNRLTIVERYHFSSDVEFLKRGITGDAMGDVTYTLRAFPNHHRALFTVIRYYTQKNRPENAKKYFTAECFFDRAIRFKPNDGTVHMLYGIYLHRLKKYDEAQKSYETALKLNTNKAEVHYNMGLLYTDMKDYNKALAHAHEAYKLGYPLQGLKNRLVRANAWR
ncbi:tetratricopeptide repeat protein [Zooshikella ganghwensis]|uniref:tetratricopeptide repeat protein n=1 Tax=Zooshikella ganghwensis TaxID=202772 RepID=UPI00041053FF|nr:tetratricopeptide repeat protein [Zooshikella ganghwensis]